MITDNDIEEAKKRTDYGRGIPKADRLHEHPDCVRIAYQWFDAQKKIKTKTWDGTSLKSKIEYWAGRYVSAADVAVAAELHPRIYGKYPEFNISKNHIEPSVQRLSDIPEAMTQMDYRERHDPSRYKSSEV
ncbi:hypothetical protein [Reinekea blandensis]|uniref:Uncharacterized protein n=1 Tax=Reinekea blandensis MED297 TaxID=314283 RepID=A4BHA2_9GAMM|nr:hypothetical protein [Reinekea blandensis]EAR08450.1 hypothetical protein MED297_17697 [Reinekea sp. MED297] [Reinekea blandensis MED297]